MTWLAPQLVDCHVRNNDSSIPNVSLPYLDGDDHQRTPTPLVLLPTTVE